eukprot:GEMP01011259.1.p1 GENE.GEMP01011259.1~~GEMP01011259.1.p1  ORF type:complete len:742 (+),score=217.06 GEMP01011259.1:147-2372(+)
MTTPQKFAQQTYDLLRQKKPLPAWRDIKGTWDSRSISLVVWSWATARVTDSDRFATMLSHAKRTDDWADKGRSMFLWSFAKASFRNLDHAYLVHMANFQDAKPVTQHWANAIWAFATLKATPTERMIDQAKQLTFPPGEFATVCWALATLSVEAELHLDVEACTRQFGPGRIAITLWAIATQKKVLRNSDEAAKALTACCVAGSTSGSTEPGSGKGGAKGHGGKGGGNAVAWKPKELANVAWALATLSHDIPRFIAEQSVKLQLLPIDVANFCWAHARTGQLDVLPLFATHAEKMTHSFSARQLAQTAWALSKNPEAFAIVAKSFIQRRSLTPCSPREVSNLLYAYAVYASAAISGGTVAPFRYSVLLDWASQCSWQQASAQDLSNAAWALGKLDLWGDVVDRIAEQVPRRSFPPHEFANVVWGLSVLDNLPSALIAPPPLSVPGWTPQGVANTIWACGRQRIALDSWNIHDIIHVATTMNATELGMTMVGLHHAARPECAHLFFAHLSARFLSLHPNGGETVDFLAAYDECRRNDDPDNDESTVWQYFTRVFLTPTIDILRHAPHNAEAFMQRAMLPHLGHCGTRVALQACGIRSATPLSPPHPIVLDVRTSAWRHRRRADAAVDASWPLPSTRTVAAAIWHTSNPAWRVFTSDDAEGMKNVEQEDVRFPWATAAFVNCTRHDHAERVALVRVVEEMKGNMEGEEVRVFVSHWPCMSCVKVFAGFRRAFPKCTLTVNWPT